MTSAIRVLHVDDEPSFGEVVATHLERTDDRITVINETTAKDGMAHLSGNPDLDCVISDYEMPGTDGLEFLEAVRATYPDLPFILYTGKGSEAVASEAIAKGVTDYLQKGSGSEQYELLANRVQNAVSQYHSSQEAQQTRRRLQNLAESTSDCIWMYDSDWEELLFISGYEQVWGRSTAAIRENPQDFINGVHRSDRDDVRDAMNRLAGGEPIDIEYRIRRHNGETGWVWVKGEPVFDDDGTVKSVVGFTRDITERKQRERQLERYERIVQSLPVGVFWTTRDGTFVDMNEQFVSLFNASTPSDFEDLHARELYADPSDREALLETLDEHGAVDGYQIEMKTLDGDYRWMETSLQLIEENGDQFLGGIMRDVTDRRQRIHQLEQAETLFENAQDALFLVDVAEDFILERVNPAHETALGLGTADVAGRTPREVFGQTEGGQIADQYHRCVEEKRPLEYEETLTIDGERTYWNTRIAPVEIDGSVEKIVGATRDITDRKHREQAIDGLDDLFYVVNKEGSLQIWNDRFQNVLGYSADELDGMAALEFFPQAEQDKLLSAFNETLSSGRATIESILQTKDGEEIPYEFTGTRLTDEDGNLIGVVGVGRDITERKDRERKLTALHSVTSDLASAPSVESVCDRTIEASEAILSFDLSVIDLEDEGMLRKQALSEEIPTDQTTDMSIEEGLAGKTYRTGESFLIDDVRDHPDANPQGPYRSAISVPIGDHGIFQAVSESVGAFDATDLELAELLISHTESALNRLAHERQLERQNERLEQFVSVVSHDLRNPLNVAEGRLELAQNEHQDEHLEEAATAVDRSLGMIEALLELARQGERVGSTESVDLAEQAALCWQTVATSDATLDIDIDRELRADATRLKQLLENLFRNAVDHGGTDVAVRVGALPDNEGFYVADNGPGIPEPQRDRVFDVGYSTRDGGHGLGLNIVREIAEAHDWALRVVESEDGGARFEVYDVEFTEPISS